MYVSFYPEEGSDYSAIDTQVVFSSTAVEGESQCISIGIIDDEDFEDAHDFTVKICGIEPPIANGLNSTVPVTIQDNNGNVCG